MNKPITSTEIETVIWKLPRNKNPGPGASQTKFCQTFREELTTILKLFQKTQEKGKLPNSFYYTMVTVLPKPDEDTT